MPRRRRIKPDDAEHLLAGRHDPEHPELSRLLDAAAGPPRPHELAGLEAALAAFEEAGRGKRRASARKRWRMLRPIAAAVGTAAVLVGGVAMAAEVGYLPGSDRPPAHERLGPRDAPSSTSPASPATTGGPARTPDPTHSSETKEPKVHRIDRLCRRWEKRHEKGKEMKAEDLRELSAAAGGEARIPAFCAPRLRPGAPATAPSATHPSPSESPKHPDRKKGGPDGKAGPPSSGTD